MSCLWSNIATLSVPKNIATYILQGIWCICIIILMTKYIKSVLSIFIPNNSVYFLWKFINILKIIIPERWRINAVLQHVLSIFPLLTAGLMFPAIHACTICWTFQLYALAVYVCHSMHHGNVHCQQNVKSFQPFQQIWEIINSMIAYNSEMCFHICIATWWLSRLCPLF